MVDDSVNIVKMATNHFMFKFGNECPQPVRLPCINKICPPQHPPELSMHQYNFQWNLNQNKPIFYKDIYLKIPSTRWWPCCSGFLVINSSPVSSPAAEVRDKLNVIHGQVGNKGGPTQPTKHSTRWWHGFLAMRQGITAWSICPENKTIKTSVLKELQMNLFCEVLLLIDNSVMI